MVRRRQINARARGKHIGHACEGHLRGLLTHLDGVDQGLVKRELPFPTPVDPDAVLLSPGGKVRAVFVVGYWEEAGSSHKKMHRTRTEYFEVLRIREAQPEYFTPDFEIVTVLYGTSSGWKEQVLRDLAEQCAPLIFVPRVRGCEWKALVDWSFGEYGDRWESGLSDAREYVEQQMAASEPDKNDVKLLRSIAAALNSDTRADPHFSKRTAATRIPSGPVSTRYRQPLGILSLFSSSEIEGWLERKNINANDNARTFALRALFLDMGSLTTTTSIRRDIVLHFHPRRAVEEDGRYAPHRPDFASWQDLRLSDLQWILDAHRNRTKKPTSVFRGGAFDQCAGNYADITKALIGGLPSVIEALQARSCENFWQAMRAARLTGPESWHPASGYSQMCPIWSFTVCALAIAVNERGLRSRYKSRRQAQPSKVDCSALYSMIQSFVELVVEILSETVPFLHYIDDAGLDQLVEQERPRLLTLDEPCSWLADVYNTLTTNSSHNPLNELLWRYLHDRFPDATWHGWPNKRSVSASVGIGDAGGRRQWGFIGSLSDLVVCAEVKSVTANHWGDKSKELYDRVGELNRAAAEAGYKVLSILVFDGDLAVDALAELGTGIAHDEIWSVDEILAKIGTKKVVGTT
jgi:hypothetical protein